MMRGSPRARALATATADAPANRRPVARIGVLADIQAADIADGAGFSGRPRYYRAAVEGAARAAAAWRAEGVDAVLHLGDIIDLNQPRPTAPAVLDRVVAALDLAGAPHYHVVGNHCLMSLGRQLANERLGMGGADHDASYYSRRLGTGWRLVALDGYDVAVTGRPEGHRHREEAERLLAANNPNVNKNSADGLVGLARRFVAFGGGVGDDQLAWLDAELADAAAAGDRVIVAIHQPLHPETAPPVCILWNHEAVLSVLAKHGPRVVAATFAGHAHRDGAAVCGAGIHHRVLGAVLEAAPGTDCYATLDLYEDGLVVRGEGAAAPSGEVRLPATARGITQA